MMFFGEQTRIIKAQAGTSPHWFGSEERFEDRAQHMLRNAGAGILQRKANQGWRRRSAFDMQKRRDPVDAGSPKSQFTAGRHRMSRIKREVGNHLLKFKEICVDGKLTGSEAGLNPDAARQDFLQNFQQAGHDFIEVLVSAFARGPLVEMSEPVSHFTGLKSGLADE